MKVDKSNKHDVVIAAVQALKKCEFKATAIKVELEAQFHRSDGDGECGGEHPCGECNGNWEDARDCYACESNGYFIRQSNGEWVTSPEGQVDGSEECEECYGSGRLTCEYCEEGYQECDEYCDEGSGEFSSERYCHNWLLERLAEHGMAKQENEVWVVKKPLSYARFYNDGSVDSEFTFTLMLDNPENIFLLPKVIEAFQALGEEIGNGIDVDGAGMHMALLNTSDGSYGRHRDISAPQIQRLNNFNKSMQLLLPALYCLGASSERSRGLSYRRPQIEVNSHRAAIDYRHGALEFRIFDTCYQNPEQILDNVVVMSKCMRYWRSKFKSSGMEKVTEQVRFGIEGSYKLDRFYITTKHIDLLNRGLIKLKPSYYTIKQIKEQRKLTTTKRTINTKLKNFRKGLGVEYEEYSSRFEWSLTVRRHRRLADMLEQAGKGCDEKEVAKKVEEYIKARMDEREKLEEYIKKREDEYMNREGDYQLCAV